MKYTLSDFDYLLPEELIAKRPLEPRDSSRLLVFNRDSGEIIDDLFSNIEAYLPTDTTLVVNNSKVEKSRLSFEGKEVFITKAINNKTVEAMVFPGKKFRQGVDIGLGDGIRAFVDDVLESGLRRITFNRALDATVFDKYRQTPFPPYVDKDETLSDRYQTVYSDPLGSKAAPTAGLHFTPALLESIKSKHDFAELTLHVGLGTFAPVKTQNLDEHEMHNEWYEITPDTARTINYAQHITAVGTTTVRTLESAYKDGSIQPGNEWTDIFISPGYEFKSVNSLVTNFHLPKSTLLMLVAAFMGYDEMKKVYAHAVEHKYRFYSFGDAMLIV